MMTEFVNYHSEHQEALFQDTDVLKHRSNMEEGSLKVPST